MGDQSKMSSNSSESGEGERSGFSPERLRREVEEEFNVQRAKMKELFLQKEEEMRLFLQEKGHLESEVLGLRAELQQQQTLSENQRSEIQSLQMLVSETVEASSSGTEEMRRLMARNLELEQQVNMLRQQQDMTIAPATLVRTIARKLGAETDDQVNRRVNLEESEAVRTAVEPLEQELYVLKEKLRSTDASLQEALKSKTPGAQTNNSSVDGKSTTGEGRVGECDMCANYEAQLVETQRAANSARDHATHFERALKMATDELEGVRSIHDETVRTWHSEREASAVQMQLLQTSVTEARAILEEKCAQAHKASQQALQRVTDLTVDREKLYAKMEQLEQDNEMLIGKFTKKAMDMQNEVIDLPNTVEELQECMLHLREQLIVCEMGRENALEEADAVRGVVLRQREDLQKLQDERASLTAHLDTTRQQLDQLESDRKQMKEIADNLRKSNDTVERLLEDKKRLQGEIQETRGRVAVLQHELDNSEKVQQDFVRLSQSLQVQLQRIREANTEVRWQHEEDVAHCPACNVALPNNKKKIHCRHCGRIYCAACVSEQVPAGPRRAPARVCRVCSTLLRPDAAPYFSTQPPTSDH